MSIHPDDPELRDAGFPALTETGRAIEFYRLERRLTKRTLAKRAGISRQQLWRVMTGKSELTPALRLRLAEVLGTDIGRSATAATGNTPSDAVLSVPGARGASLPSDVGGAPNTLPDFESYVRDRRAIEVTFDTLPSDHPGAQLRRHILNALEELAALHGIELPMEFFELRRQVVSPLREIARQSAD